MKKKGLNILIVDDHFIIVKGMELFLTKYYDFFLFKACEYDSALNILELINIDLVVLDLNINGKVDFDILNKIKLVQPETKILIFSTLKDEMIKNKSMIHGANGFLSKISDEKEIKKAINQILETGVYFKNRFQNKIVVKSLGKKKLNVLDCLSKREIDVAKLIIKGVKNKEICNELKLKMTTVSTYKRRIFEKFKIDNIISLSKIMKESNHIE